MNTIENQYRTPENLNTRISIHEKYSVNKQPFGAWLLSNYALGPEDRILELGCGTADMWKGNLSLLPEGARLTLTDFSSGMLLSAKENTEADSRVDYRVVDIQDIPYEAGSFDTVIANMMLYHVPDLDRGLSEVRRVLKPGGRFYCATYGENGIMAFVNDTLGEYGIRGRVGGSFTLRNGGEILGRYFTSVEKRTREDGLAITHVPDFVAYVRSMSSLSGMEKADESLLTKAFTEKCVDGILHVPKEYGMFICK